jgi:transposase
MKQNTTFFVEWVVPDLVEHICQESRRKTLRGIMAHLDNALPHNNRKSETALTATKARRIHAPTYSPDLSPSDFSLFRMLKERMSGTPYSSPDEPISGISELIASLSKDQFVSIYKNWMKRINWMINDPAEYYHKSVKLNLTNC